MLSSGDVVALDLGTPEGHEEGFLHPAVLITAQRIVDAEPSVVHVVPLTSTERRFHSEIGVDPDAHNGLDARSVAQCQHVRAISTRRIRGVRGNVGSVALRQIRETVGVLLDL